MVMMVRKMYDWQIVSRLHLGSIMSIYILLVGDGINLIRAREGETLLVSECQRFFSLNSTAVQEVTLGACMCQLWIKQMTVWEAQDHMKVSIPMGPWKDPGTRTSTRPFPPRTLKLITVYSERAGQIRF